MGQKAGGAATPERRLLEDALLLLLQTPWYLT